MVDSKNQAKLDSKKIKCEQLNGDQGEEEVQ